MLYNLTVWLLFRYVTLVSTRHRQDWIHDGCDERRYVRAVGRMDWYERSHPLHLGRNAPWLPALPGSNLLLIAKLSPVLNL